jgi:hypothetical protein
MASVYEKRGRGTSYLRVTDATRRGVDVASTAQSKVEARRLGTDFERKAEQQRLGLEPLPTECRLTMAELVEWWLRERCPEASYDREKTRVRKNVSATLLGDAPVGLFTAAKIDDHLHVLRASERARRQHPWTRAEQAANNLLQGA